MSDAFVYMFVVASGAASGVAVVAFICYKLFKIMQRREMAAAGKNRKRRGIV